MYGKIFLPIIILVYIPNLGISIYGIVVIIHFNFKIQIVAYNFENVY